MDINLTLHQRQALSQSQIQSLNILSFDSIELNQFLQDEYLENPILDYTETVPGIADAESLHSYTDTLPVSGSDSLRTADIPKLEDTAIKQYLLQQLDSSRYSRFKWKLISYLIDCLDSNGYFGFTPEEIAKQTGADTFIITECLTLLRSLEPAGVFSSCLTDCLISQLDKKNSDYEIMKTIISCHLEDIAAGKISSVSRALSLSTADVRKCIARIRMLNPKPLSDFMPGKEQYIIPDIIFTKESDNWKITLNDSWIANYHLNDYYIKMLPTAADPELRTYFGKKLARIQFIFSCIEQRRKTLLSIAGEILKEQEAFFNSTGNLRPMTMASLSERLDVHPSTFSRAVKGKYIQFPKGTVPCKELFCTPVISNGAMASYSQSDIKDLIRQLINAENKKKPYSDQTLVKLLKEHGITISRRAAANYRLEAGFASSVERKEDFL